MALIDKDNARWFGHQDTDAIYYPPCKFYSDFEIGEKTTIGSFCDIGGKVGKNCKIQCHVSIPPLTVVEDNVFIGPGVKICNDKKMDGNMKGITIKSGAKIGAGAIILANVGENALIGAGAVVTKDIPDGEIWYGNPAERMSYENLNNRQ